MKQDNFLEYKGNLSSMRAAFMFTAIVSSTCAGVGGLGLAVMDIIMNNGANLAGVAMIIAALAGVAFTAFNGKARQAQAELKNKEGVENDRN